MKHIKPIKDLLLALHRDEQGAESLEKLLLVGVVVIPLLGVLIWFRDEISQWVQGLWGDIQNEGERNPLN